jgi:electron transfer flavoprotein alpha subunit
MKALLIVENSKNNVANGFPDVLHGVPCISEAGLEVIPVILGVLTNDLRERLAELGVPFAIGLDTAIDPWDSVVVSSVIEYIESLMEQEYIVVGYPSLALRDSFGRLAVRRNAEVISGVTKLSQNFDGSFDMQTLFEGGERMAHVHIPPRVPLYCLLDPLASASSACVAEHQELETETHPVPVVRPSIRIVAQSQSSENTGTPLGAARFVVAGGRGVGSKHAMEQLEKWAHSVGASFGSSRAPVEAQWTSYDKLIGQTGTEVSPELYIAFGISGAPQHLSGIRNAKRIVAINNDPTAPIVQHADLTIIADIPALMRKLGISLKLTVNSEDSPKN